MNATSPLTLLVAKNLLLLLLLLVIHGGLMTQTHLQDKLQRCKVYLLGFPYRIKFVKGMLDKFHVAGCSGIFSGEIDLEPDITPADICAALCHELVELFLAKTETAVDHNVITKLEVFMMDLFIHNPELVRVILEETEKINSSEKRGKKTLKRVERKSQGTSR